MGTLLAFGVSGCNIAAAGVSVVVLAAVGIVGYGCGEPVDVTVWDRRVAHNVCDATVTAEHDGTVSEFSPCYRLYLGDGTWKITAKKPGYEPAYGTVIVNEKRKCSEPTFHSVALTMYPAGEAPATAPAPASAPALPPAPVVVPAPQTDTAAPPEPALTSAPAPTSSAPPASPAPAP